MGSSSPIFGVNIKNIWNHHPVLIYFEQHCDSFPPVNTYKPENPQQLDDIAVNQHDLADIFIHGLLFHIVIFVFGGFVNLFSRRKGSWWTRIRLGA